MDGSEGTTGYGCGPQEEVGIRDGGAVHINGNMGEGSIVPGLLGLRMNNDFTWSHTQIHDQVQISIGKVSSPRRRLRRFWYGPGGPLTMLYRRTIDHSLPTGRIPVWYWSCTRLGPVCTVVRTGEHNIGRDL